MPSPYDILHKTLFGSKLQCIRFDEANVFVRVYDGTRLLFGPEKGDTIYSRIWYLISQKSDITFSFSHNFAKIKIDSYDSLPLEKILIVSNVIILSKWVFNKGKNRYYDNTFLEKCSYKDDMLELTILKELNLIKQMNQKNVIFVTIGVFQMKLLYVDSEIQLDNKPI